MKVWGLAQLRQRQELDGHPYLEFLREASMSAGLYVLPAGGVDRQEPHTEDEIYIVLTGSARFTAGETIRDVGAGDVLFVPAGVPHRFHDISAELRLAVMFAPPEGFLAAG